jgi:hypothetical protein
VFVKGTHIAIDAAPMPTNALAPDLLNAYMHPCGFVRSIGSHER